MSLDRIDHWLSIGSNVLSISFSLAAIWHARRYIAERIKAEAANAAEAVEDSFKR